MVEVVLKIVLLLQNLIVPDQYIVAFELQEIFAMFLDSKSYFFHNKLSFIGYYHKLG